MLISVRKWEHRHSLRFALFIRLLALLATAGMIPMCIASGIWLATMWSMFPQIEQYSPGTQIQLIIGFVLMVLAIPVALVALVHSTLALRAAYAASPKQKPLQQVQVQD